MSRFLILSLLAVGCFLGGCHSCPPCEDWIVEVEVEQVEKVACSVEVKDSGFYGRGVVRYFNADCSSYITEQNHWVDFKSNSIVMTGNEPGGGFECSLAKGEFCISGYGDSVHSPRDYATKSLAEIVLTAISVAGNIADDKCRPVDTDPVRIKGKWYRQLCYFSKDSPDGSIKLYQTIDDSIVDLIEVVDTETGLIFTGRVYNYRWFENIGRSLPMKIDIFNGGCADSDQEMIAQIVYQTVTVR